MSQNEYHQAPQYSLSKAIILHLLPGLCIFLFYLILWPTIASFRFQPSFTVLIGFVIVGMPLQLYIMMKAGQQGLSIQSVKNVLYYTKRLPFWQYIVLVILFFFYAGLIMYLLSPVSNFLRENILSNFSFLPADAEGYFQKDAGKTIILFGFIILLIIDGIINPIVEELYFRGYLLPRISRFGIFSPFINAILFAIAHFWQIWNFLQIFLIVAPLYYLVWRKQSIYLSVIAHCLANITGAIATMGLFFASN